MLMHAEPVCFSKQSNITLGKPRDHDWNPTNVLLIQILSPGFGTWRGRAPHIGFGAGKGGDREEKENMKTQGGPLLLTQQQHASTV